MAFYGVANRAILVSLIASSGFRRLVGFANCKLLPSIDI
jgi:hypothetical protein